MSSNVRPSHHTDRLPLHGLPDREKPPCDPYASREGERNSRWVALSDDTELFSSFFQSNSRPLLPHGHHLNRAMRLPSSMQGRYPVHATSLSRQGIETATDSSPSGSSPMFSDLGTVRSQSPDSLGVHRRPRRTANELPLEGGLLPTSRIHNRNSIPHEDPRTEEEMQAFQRQCLEESRIAIQRALQAQSQGVTLNLPSTFALNTPVSRTSTAVDMSAMGECELPDSAQGYARPYSRHLDNGFGDDDTSLPSSHSRSRHADDDVLVDSNIESIPLYNSVHGLWHAQDTMPSLRPLRLVSNHLGAQRRHPPRGGGGVPAAPVDAPAPPVVRPSSPGAIHGLNIEIPGESDVSKQLRPLQLPAMHEAEVSHRIPRSNQTPELAPLPFPKPAAHRPDDTLSSTSSKPSSRKRVPFAELHPPTTKAAKADAEKLFWYGFLGMPWLWLLGGWGLDDTGALLSPWSAPSFISYRSGLHPYGPPFALSACARNRNAQPAETEAHKGMQYLQDQRDAPRTSLFKQDRWKHIEKFVVYNRIAAALSAFAIFACWATGIWAVVSHF